MKKRSGRSIGLLIGSLASVWLLVPLRVVNPAINQFVVLFMLEVIFLSFGFVCACLQFRAWIRVVSSIPFFLASALFPFALMVSMVAGGPIAEFDVLDSADLIHSRIVVYRLSGGATSDCAIKVVQEMPVLPGIILVKDLVKNHPGNAAVLKATKGDTVMVGIDNKIFERVVRKFVYF